jgi:hypothetical protein
MTTVTALYMGPEKQKSKEYQRAAKALRSKLGQQLGHVRFLCGVSKDLDIDVLSLTQDIKATIKVLQSV